MGHSMSNQHKKNMTLADFDKTWVLHSLSCDIHPQSVSALYVVPIWLQSQGHAKKSILAIFIPWYITLSTINLLTYNLHHLYFIYQIYPIKVGSKVITGVLYPLLSQINFLLNVLYGLLFKRSKIGFGTAMGFGDT